MGFGSHGLQPGPQLSRPFLSQDLLFVSESDSNHCISVTTGEIVIHVLVSILDTTGTDYFCL